ncbi:MAG TPA: polysaccharide deacetylase family protein [Kofleriaceae bacterium]|nr:polysaccharide deacetylase family protein [Kofleriaceae bacterium]
MKSLPLAIWITTAAACTTNEDKLEYGWDDRRIVCSRTFDDLSHPAPWDEITAQLAAAREHAAVTFLHAHDPDVSVSRAAIERVLETADMNGLDYVTFPELVPGPPRGAVALAFDDTAIEGWSSIRGQLAAHGARATFFVTRLHLWTDDQIALLAGLREDGHAIEAHSVDHRQPRAYVDERSAAAYLDEEVLPSIALLEERGFAVTSFAYPFGEDVPEIDDVLLERVGVIRVGPRTCPN